MGLLKWLGARTPGSIAVALTIRLPLLSDPCRSNLVVPVSNVVKLPFGNGCFIEK